MLYGNEYFGVLECNYSLAAVHLVTAFVGPQFYEKKVGTYLDLPIVKDWSEYGVEGGWVGSPVGVEAWQVGGGGRQMQLVVSSKEGSWLVVACRCTAP
jgi:hypothetical protein